MSAAMSGASGGCRAPALRLRRGPFPARQDLWPRAWRISSRAAELTKSSIPFTLLDRTRPGIGQRRTRPTWCLGRESGP
jgi:hypothetical protein